MGTQRLGTHTCSLLILLKINGCRLTPELRGRKTRLFLPVGFKHSCHFQPTCDPRIFLYTLDGRNPAPVEILDTFGNYETQ